ncbi:MAG TPA: ROK family protein [Bryobacteraceae bacterium]|jgi:glucokinase|nr:ROK family protein [Bryobacteraceae bacterium]
MKQAIGIDLGATELRAALVDESGAVLAYEKVKTNKIGGPESVLAQMENLVANVKGRNEVTGVGVAAPGPLNSETGIVLDPPTLPGWKNFELRRVLASRLQMPVSLNNDANAAAYGEWRFGGGRGSRHLVYITVSTGIGGGVVAGGRLLLGHGGFAAELGHMSIALDGPMCLCGHLGCWESLASGTALAKFAEEAVRECQSSLMIDLACGGPIQAHHVGAAAAQGDPLALSLLQDEARYLTVGLINVLHLFAPEIVLIGGGVAASFPLMKPTILEGIQKRAMPSYRQIPIQRAELEDPGVVGAAALAMDAEAGKLEQYYFSESAPKF